MKKAITMCMVLILLALLPTTVMAKGLMEGFSSDSSSKNAEAPDLRIGRQSRPPTPRASGNTYTNSAGMRFTLIQPGTVKMGVGQYETSITRPYYIGITNVTVRQWEAVMGMNADTDFANFNRTNSGRPGPDGHMQHFSWYDAQDFINMLNLKEGTNRYRLPTQAEWEHAVRAGTAMSGHNEWMSDWLDDKYFSRMPAADPWGPLEGGQKVIRRGTWTARGADRIIPGIGQVPRWRPTPLDPLYVGFRVVLDTDHPSEVPAKPQRQFTVEARRNDHRNDALVVGDHKVWRYGVVWVKINGGPEQVVLSMGRSPLKRSFSAAIGDKVEVLWMGGADHLGVEEVFVYYADTPARNPEDNANILARAHSGSLKLSYQNAASFGTFTVTARGTPNSITYGEPAAGQVTTAPGTFTVELQMNPAYNNNSWTPNEGSIWMSVNGGLPTVLVAQPATSTSIRTPHKANFTARAGDRVQIIWRAGSGSRTAQVFVYRNDRPAGSINDTANVLGAIPYSKVQTPNSGSNPHTGENVVVDILVR